uniref:Uncharacterized protein n=1 Tax=Panagrellus redivivus TaxID=6233 RepID=A0A7E4VU21_PANRE
MFTYYLFLVAFFLCTNAELTVKKGFSGAVSFDEELRFRIDNPQLEEGEFTICLKSSADATSERCPQGYAAMSKVVTGIQASKTYKLLRDGTVNLGEVSIDKKDLHFNSDKSIDILIAQLPKSMSVIIVNGEKVEESKTKTTEVVIGIVAGCVGLLLILLLVGFLTYWFVIRKRWNKVPAVVAIEEGGNIEREQPAVEEPPKPMIVIVKPQNSQKTTATRNVATITTKPSTEKFQTPPPTTPKCATIPPPPVTTVTKIIEEAVPEPAPTHVTLETAKAPKKSKPKKGKNPKSKSEPKATLPSTPNTTTKAPSPILPVDRTQSATERSPTQPTLPTPEFGDNLTANTLAAKSAYNPREYVPANEAPVPGRPMPRPKKIADEVDDFQKTTEVYLCHAQRRKELSGHDHMRIVDRINFLSRHNVSDAERNLLKASAKDAPRLADIVVKEVDEWISTHGSYGGSFDEGLHFWRAVNDPPTPASVGLVILYRNFPETFKLEKRCLSDPKFRTMPLSGLYMFLLDGSLPHGFRVELAAELRARASKVVPYVQRDLLKYAAFPSQYLMRIYQKNNLSFVEGSEIHSKSRSHHSMG